jgi:predicted HAD superfamily Cof-like phosphohydrolase
MNNPYDGAIKPKTYAHAVVDFNQRVLKIDPRSLHPLAGGELHATMKAFQEEITEFQDAINSGDFLGQIDAVVDLTYYAFGALYKMGLTGDQIQACCMAVHDANMEKKLGVVPKRGNPLGDAVKPDGWVGPEERIAEILEG